MQVTCLQVAPRGTEPAAERRRRAAEQLRAAEQADLYVLPELWPVGYFAFDRYEAAAETLHGPTVSAISEAAVQLNAYVHLGSFVEHDGHGRLANTSVLLAPDGTVAATYRKIHVFGYGSREAELVAPGTDLAVADVAGLRIGFATCYDLRFPELFRQLVDLGAQAFVIPACWPQARVGHWELLLAARAIENLAVSIGCNAVGTDGGVELGGATQIVDPWGEVLARAGATEQAVSAAIDPADVDRTRAAFPALQDRILGRSAAGVSHG